MLINNLVKYGIIRAVSLPAVGAMLRPYYGGIGTIFTLHRIVRTQEESLVPGICITVEFLDEILRYVIEEGFDVITLSEVANRLSTEELGRPFVCFTFDDGFKDTLTLALPVFRRYGKPFTSFLVSSYVDETDVSYAGVLEEFILEREHVSFPHPTFSKGLPSRTYAEKMNAYAMIMLQTWREVGFSKKLINMIQDQGLDANYATRKLFLGTSDVQALATAPLCEIGSHTLNHTSLTTLTDSELFHDLSMSRCILSEIIGRNVDVLAYPFGSKGECGMREFNAARKAGYRAAVTTRLGNIFPDYSSHLMDLPRNGLSLWPHAHNLHFIRACLSGARNAIMNRGKRRSLL